MNPKANIEVKWFRHHLDQVENVKQLSAEPASELEGERFYRDLLSNAVMITEPLFPRVWEGLQRVHERLGLEEDAVRFFVKNDPSIQAFAVHRDSISHPCHIVCFHSGLIERLTPEEVAFVAGHELAHLMCGHWKYPRPGPESSIGDCLILTRLSRSAEITADRIGFYACGSLEHSCSAMIKTLAGLGSPYINPHISSVLNQFRELTRFRKRNEITLETHPVLPLRIRGLIHLDQCSREMVSMSEAEVLGVMRNVDRLVDRDYEKTNHLPFKEMKREGNRKLTMWALAYLVVDDGVVSKEEQNFLQSSLGKANAEKILGFLRNISGNPLDAVGGKIKAMCQHGLIEWEDWGSVRRKLREGFMAAGVEPERYEEAFRRLDSLCGGPE